MIAYHFQYSPYSKLFFAFLVIPHVLSSTSRILSPKLRWFQRECVPLDSRPWSIVITISSMETRDVTMSKSGIFGKCVATPHWNCPKHSKIHYLQAFYFEFWLNCTVILSPGSTNATSNLSPWPTTSRFQITEFDTRPSGVLPPHAALWAGHNWEEPVIWNEMPAQYQQNEQQSPVVRTPPNLSTRPIFSASSQPCQHFTKSKAYTDVEEFMERGGWQWIRHVEIVITSKKQSRK